MIPGRDQDMANIDGEVIATHLARTGYRNMAEHVRRLAERDAAAYLRYESLRKHCDMLAIRLEAYEPKDKPHDPRPPAEASD